MANGAMEDQDQQINRNYANAMKKLKWHIMTHNVKECKVKGLTKFRQINIHVEYDCE